MGATRTLGIDHGESRIGLALSDESGLIARPLQIIRHTARAADAELIAKLAAEKEVKLIIIGLPLDAEGRVGHQARKVQRWAAALKLATAIPIEFWDESFSSVEAERLPAAAHRAGPSDDRAAAILLQNYLDAHRPAA
jgi:putative Holliday junction resolvase